MAAVRLGLREMRRAKGRFGLLAGAVGVLVFLIVFQQALLGGLVTEFVGAIRNQSADVLVLGEDARLNLQGSVVAPDAVDAVANVDGVREAGPLGVATVTIDDGGQLRDATLFGHLLDGLGAPRSIADGRRPTRDDEAVVSTGHGLGVGDRVEIPRAGVTIEIVGTAERSSFSVTPTLFVSYATYEQVQLASNPDAPAVVPSAVAATVDGDAGEVADRIQREVDGVEAATRARAAAEAPGVSSVSQSLGVVVLLTYVVATIVIGFFFLILTVQKTQTLTLLRAVGAPARRLVAALATQVAAVVGTGFVVGTLLSMLALRSSGTGIGARVEPGALGSTAVVTVVLAVVACIGSVRRITRLDPADATHPGAR